MLSDYLFARGSPGREVSLCAFVKNLYLDVAMLPERCKTPTLFKIIFRCFGKNACDF